MATRAKKATSVSQKPKKRGNNPENITKQTPERRAELGRKGGIASGEAKRRKKTFKELAQLIKDAQLPDHKKAEFQTKFPDIDIEQVTVAMGVMMAHAEKAMNGDVQSSIFLRDTAGEKPVDVIQQDITNSDGSFHRKIEDLSDEELDRILDELS